MLRRSALALTKAASRPFSAATMASQTPMEDAIRAKITSSLNPSRLEIYNDSWKHAHHKAMEGSTSKETHFRIVMTSEGFKGKMQPARHRLIYTLLKDEMAQEGGIHALQLKTMTPEEEQRLETREKAEGAAEAS